MIDRAKKLPARFYISPTGRNPVREWIMQLPSEDRRTVGTISDDQEIELRAGSRIGNKYGDKVHVTVTSFNRMVLLTGEVPNESVKQSIERIARSAGLVPKFTSVPPEGMTGRGSYAHLSLAGTGNNGAATVPDARGRYTGQTPGQAAFVPELQRSLDANIGYSRILTYLKFLDGTLLLRLILDRGLNGRLYACIGLRLKLKLAFF